MRTSVEQDKQFISEVISHLLLEDSINYIINNYTAEEVYGKEVLQEWAEENGYILSDENN